MFDHIGLKVKDLDASVRFYRAALEPLGQVLDDSGSGFGPPGEPALWLFANKHAHGGTHLAIRTANRKAVDRFYQAGL
jgi:catechol 2,3-dioxygenase-like lactoylglutathione lyase family enzyme